MKTLGKDERTANITDRECCRYCADDGLVVVQTRGPFEEMGPCPFCQQGYLLEFGDPGQSSKREWPNGFWQGRPPTGIVPLEEEGSRPLSQEENARRMRELMARMVGVTVDMNAPVDDCPDFGVAA